MRGLPTRHGGGQLNLANLDLIQKRNHILHAALAALPEKSRQLLSTLALLSEAVDYPTLSALNPHLPPELEEVEEPEKPEDGRRWNRMSDDEKEQEQQDYQDALRRRKEYEASPQDPAKVPELLTAPQELTKTVRDLERRGLLQYDAQTKRYDLHPVVRGIAAGGLRQEEKEHMASAWSITSPGRPTIPTRRRKHSKTSAMASMSSALCSRWATISRPASLLGRFVPCSHFQSGGPRRRTCLSSAPSSPKAGPPCPERGQMDASDLANNAGIGLTLIWRTKEALAAMAPPCGPLKATNWERCHLHLRNISHCILCRRGTMSSPRPRYCRSK